MIRSTLSSLTVTTDHLRANHNADVAQDKHKSDTPALYLSYMVCYSLKSSTACISVKSSWFAFILVQTQIASDAIRPLLLWARVLDMPKNVYIQVYFIDVLKVNLLHVKKKKNLIRILLLGYLCLFLLRAGYLNANLI